MPSRPEDVVTEQIVLTDNELELRLRFPSTVQAGEARWTIGGDVLEIEHLGLRPPYLKAFLVPIGWEPTVYTESSDLRIRLIRPI